MLAIFAVAIFSQFASIRSICCITAAPSSRVKFSMTTMNWTENFFWFLGLRMVTRNIPSGLSSVSPLLPNTFRQLDIFFVDLLDRKDIHGCTTIDMELNGLFIDKHLYVNFAFRDAVDSACYLWLWGHTINELFLAGFAFCKFNIVCFLFCFALGCDMTTHTAPSSAIGSASTMFSPTEITRLAAHRHLVIIVPVWIILVCLLRIFGSGFFWFLWFWLWFLWFGHLHFTDILRFLSSLVHIL